MSKWNAMWGNATSVTERREAEYAKNITLRYSIKCNFDASKIRIRFSNICGDEAVCISKAFVAVYKGGSAIDKETLTQLTFASQESAKMEAGCDIMSDEVEFECKKGCDIAVSMYFKDMTQLRSSVITDSTTSEFFFAHGDWAEAEELPMDLRVVSAACHFLNTVEVLTDDAARTLVLYGDSITAQTWPDRLNMKLLENGINAAAIRRGVSGSRVLGQYDALQYAHYGLSGKNRFVRECTMAGADTVLIFHGINDLIHPDGINPYRPMSNFPTLDEMKEGYRYYIAEARKLGLKVYMATLLPIEGWRTYADFREELRVQVNEWIRTTDEIDGVIDFDAAVRDEVNPKALKAEYNSGDCLHPSGKGAQALADTAFGVLFCG